VLNAEHEQALDSALRGIETADERAVTAEARSQTIFREKNDLEATCRDLRSQLAECRQTLHVSNSQRERVEAEWEKSEVACCEANLAYRELQHQVAALESELQRSREAERNAVAVAQAAQQDNSHLQQQLQAAHAAAAKERADMRAEYQLAMDERTHLRSEVDITDQGSRRNSDARALVASAAMTSSSSAAMTSSSSAPSSQGCCYPKHQGKVAGLLKWAVHSAGKPPLRNPGAVQCESYRKSGKCVQWLNTGHCSFDHDPAARIRNAQQ